MASRLLSSLPFALIALALGVPTLTSLHVQPQTVFAAEWLTAWLLIIALGATILAPQLERRLSFGTPLVVGLVFVGVNLLWAFHGANLGYALYGCVFMAAYLLGNLLARSEGAAWVVLGLLGAAVLQSIAGTLQLADIGLNGLILRKIYLQAFGNVGQANHYADLIYLGMGSLALLWAGPTEARRQGANLVNLLFPLLGIVLAISAALSASRGVWLYIGGFATLGALAMLRGDATGRRFGAGLLLLAGISVLAQLFVSYSGILSHLGVVSSIDRASDAGSNGQRLYNWHAAWLAIKEHPWVGQGPGTFYKASIDAMFVTPAAAYPKFAEHAHNLPLNLGAELGIPLAVFVMLGLLLWFLRHAFAKPLSAVRVWALVCFAVVGLHSMVEYPLWYTYFVIPVGLCAGIADAEGESRGTWRLSQLAVAVLAAVGIALAAWVMHDWLAVRNAYDALNAEEPAVEMTTRFKVREELASVSRFSPFAYLAEGLRLQSWHPEEGGAAEIARLCDQTWQYKPAWYLMMRCGEAYAVMGRGEALDRLARAGCDGFPKHHAPLSDWAREFDASGVGKVKILGRACLR